MRQMTALSIMLLSCAVSYACGAAVMSIDLGSEWVKVGVVSPGVPMEIALNKESKRKTPAVIAFRDNTRIFGEDAQTIGLRFPSATYFYLLDLLGKQIDNPIVELYRKRFPYYELVADPQRNTVQFKAGDDIYSVEELIAQFIQKAREYAEDSTGQQITECVIVVPGYFGQAERLALLSAANLANIKVLQLINDYTAVALNYGIFRRKEINETAQYYVFYDMGAYKTSAAVVSYQLVKDKVTRETNPVIQVLGVGYDRTLGGLEMQLRLRDFLAKKFNEMKKTPTDVFTNPRALAKLFKEAGRLKNVLSANANHFAQIESLLDDQDFKLAVTREEFEELCADLFERVPGPLNQALKASDLSLDIMNQVILFGGGTRVPKVQEVLKKTIKQELGKNINMDEAACMGAVYRAADLATGFKVKTIITKDAIVFPIQVTFEREGESGNVKTVKRSLFGPMNAYPQKKVITFNKHTTDFEFNVNYAELDHLNAVEVNNLGSLHLAKIKLHNVANIISEATDEKIAESKGIKAHFTVDDSGIFELTGVELVVEKSVLPTEEEGTFSKLGNTISKLFSGDKDDSAEVTKEEEPLPSTTTESPPTSSNDTAPETASTNTTESETTNSKEETANNTATNKTEAKPKTVTVKQPIPNDVEYLYTLSLDGDSLVAARKKIEDLNKLEKVTIRRETALNALESFVIDTNQKLDEEEYANCGTPAEIEEIRKACAETSDWLYEDGEGADAESYENRLLELQKSTNDIYARHWEHNERPEALKTLDSMIESATTFLANAQNFTKEVNPEKDVYTPVELETLSKVIQTAKEFRDTEVEAQDKLQRHEPVRLTVKNLTEKMALIDREVKYLVNKLKIWRPKVKDTPKKEKESKAKRNDTKTIKDEVSEEESSEENADFKAAEDEENANILEKILLPKTEEAQTEEGIKSNQQEIPELAGAVEEPEENEEHLTPHSEL